MTGRRTDLDSKELSIAAADAASDKKAEDILVLNVSEVTTIADLFAQPREPYTRALLAAAVLSTSDAFPNATSVPPSRT